MKKNRDKKQTISKKELDKILFEIDREFNLTMAKLNRLYQKKMDIIKQATERQDKERLEKLRKNILKK